MFTRNDMISSITLCNVPITKTQQIDFNTVAEQQNYFFSHSVATYNNCKYVPRGGTIRIRGYADSLLGNANYGYYTNVYDGNSKRYYFYIVSRKALARETTELTIAIDCFQTYLFDINLLPCFIERETVDDDTFGVHTYPEDFELGDYVTTFTSVSNTHGYCDYFIAIADEEMGGVFGQTYSGFCIKYYDFTSVNLLSQYINELNESGKIDTVAYIFMFPHNVLLASGANFNVGEKITSYEGTLNFIESHENAFLNNFSFNNETYTPYNKKLMTYPYNFLTLRNASGSNVVLKHELFENPQQELFNVEAVLFQNARVSVTPKNYCGKELSYSDSILTDGYGLGSWINDNYANWYAQNSATITAQSKNATRTFKTQSAINSNNYSNAIENADTNLIKGGLSAVGSLLNLQVGSAVSGGINAGIDYNQSLNNASNDITNNTLLNSTNYNNTITSLMASVQDASVQPNTAKGDTSACGLDVARGTNCIFYDYTQIKPEYAKKIDMYFQMYGYKVNRVGTPNIKSRERWNYIKTVGCTLDGDKIPYEDREVIQNDFDNGLTIWHSPSYFKNYDVKNLIKEV